MNIAFHTLGCKVNQYETEVMREAFIKKGYTIVPDNAPFDIIIINSSMDDKIALVLNIIAVMLKSNIT